ncbi:hypothetical protein TD95_003723 [Thielaviopsis punctulata]|uniref:Inhibitor of growth protein N-terminal histone-binding domain-containing protein n=1 Tax=Thielaviopsis punctulata TaxID=72032 RepID=A0A0F4ZDH9_9PEZI|nr:hypothetical protein TD95_003723 [Thielaviopsis punctulata]
MTSSPHHAVLGPAPADTTGPESTVEARTETEAYVDAGAVSPRSKSGTEPSAARSFRESLEAMDMRTDPDAQATVTDFLDFTDHLPSDLIRSLTLIGKLDDTYIESSQTVNSLATKWAALPSQADSDADAPDIRAELSDKMNLALRARIHSHAEAVRMAENVNRHHARAQTLLAKLKAMLDNYPSPEDQEKSPVTAVKSLPVPKKTHKHDPNKPKKTRAPKIIIPGEVLAPYELDDESSASDTGSDSGSDSEPPAPLKPITPPPIVRHRHTGRLGRPPNPALLLTSTTPAIAAAAAAAVGMAAPPPTNAPPGSPDAPWLRLTPFELAKLRKRMKKNATWSPSETMIARELNNLGRGPEAYRLAKQKALEEGRPFDELTPAGSVQAAPPVPAVQPATTNTAMAVDAPKDAPQTSQDAMQVDDAMKLDRDAMAKRAAEEAEESERKMGEIARRLMPSTPTPESGRAKTTQRSAGKRKRAMGEDEASETPENSAEASTKSSAAAATSTIGNANVATPAASTAASAAATRKRVKTETPIPPPKISLNGPETKRAITPVPQPVLQSTTPVPPPVHGTIQGSDGGVKAKSMSPSHAMPAQGTIVKTEAVPRKSTTPILPPTRDLGRRETRADTGKNALDVEDAGAAAETAPPPENHVAKRLSLPPSRNTTPRSTPAPEAARTPGSRGNAQGPDSQLGVPVSAAGERQRRISATRGTPGATEGEDGQVSGGAAAGASTTTTTTTSTATGPTATTNGKGAVEGAAAIAATAAAAASAPAAAVAATGLGQRAKRPANTTSSGDNSAVGKRKGATRKKARTAATAAAASTAAPPPPPPTTMTTTTAGNKKEKEKEKADEEEVDEDGVPIDPNEPRYYCRKQLNIGEKGEVTSRGVKT